MASRYRLPTPEEDEAINRGIAPDPDNPEWTDEDFARARPLREVDPELYATLVNGRVPHTAKARVSLRLDLAVLDAFRAGGRGWQGRANAVLRKAVLGE